MAEIAVRPKSRAETYLQARWQKGKNNPPVSDSIRSRRLVAASFAGLIARLQAEGWTDEVIEDAMADAKRTLRLRPSC